MGSSEGPLFDAVHKNGGKERVVTRCKSFEFVARPDAKIVILGSLPGAKSLEKRQYYAKPQNVFWRIMGDLVGAKPEKPYDERLQELIRHRIALWDVCATAEREGSLDSNIKKVIPNEFKRFFDTHKLVEAIFFNGQPAEKLFRRHVAPGRPLPCFVLPSTSPAHARMPYEQKLAIWRKRLSPFLART